MEPEGWDSANPAPLCPESSPSTRCATAPPFPFIFLLLEPLDPPASPLPDAGLVWADAFAAAGVVAPSLTGCAGAGAAAAAAAGAVASVVRCSGAVFTNEGGAPCTGGLAPFSADSVVGPGQTEQVPDLCTKLGARDPVRCGEGPEGSVPVLKPSEASPL